MNSMLVLSFVLFLLFAAFCAYQAEQHILNVLPGDLIVPVVAGIIGVPLGNNLISHFGPDIAGIFLMPSMIGAVVLALVASFMHPIYSSKVHERLGN